MLHTMHSPTNVRQFANFLKTECHAKLFTVGSIFCSSFIVNIDVI